MGKWVKYNITPTWLFFFFPEILLTPRANPHNQFLCCLIRRESIPGYCIPRGIKLQSFHPQIQDGRHTGKSKIAISQQRLDRFS